MSETIGKRSRLRPWTEEDDAAFEEWFASWVEQNGTYYTEGEVECRHIQLRAAYDAGMERGQETIDLERSKDLLRGLAHGHYVGIATTDVGVNCVYCDWQHEKYGAEPLHTDDCPITKARRFLRGV